MQDNYVAEPIMQFKWPFLFAKVVEKSGLCLRKRTHVICFRKKV